jgi:arsenite methyltransferase
VDANIDVKTIVKERYGETARTGSGCCGGTEASRAIGYSADQLAEVPAAADLGLGCGNPTALAGIRAGETVLDLGAGAGLDCFLAARDVGPTGRVIGVDMTPDMLARARANAAKAGFQNVEFREGEIEHLPVEDNSIDLVISNCVINLSPEKPQVFREIHRVLKPGGRMLVSDIVLNGPLPEAVKNDIAAYAACIAGAAQKGEYLSAIHQAGLREVTVVKETQPPQSAHSTDPFTKPVAKYLCADDGSSRISSISVRAVK